MVGLYDPTRGTACNATVTAVILAMYSVLDVHSERLGISGSHDCRGSFLLSHPCQNALLNSGAAAHPRARNMHAVPARAIDGNVDEKTSRAKGPMATQSNSRDPQDPRAYESRHEHAVDDEIAPHFSSAYYRVSPFTSPESETGF